MPRLFNVKTGESILCDKDQLKPMLAGKAYTKSEADAKKSSAGYRQEVAEKEAKEAAERAEVAKKEAAEAAKKAGNQA